MVKTRVKFDNLHKHSGETSSTQSARLAACLDIPRWILWLIWTFHPRKAYHADRKSQHSISWYCCRWAHPTHPLVDPPEVCKWDANFWSVFTFHFIFDALQKKAPFNDEIVVGVGSGDDIENRLSNDLVSFAWLSDSTRVSLYFFFGVSEKKKSKKSFFTFLFRFLSRLVCQSFQFCSLESKATHQL